MIISTNLSNSDEIQIGLNLLIAVIIENYYTVNEMFPFFVLVGSCGNGCSISL